MAELNEYDSVNGVSDEEITRRFQEAVRLANERKRIKGLPIQKYDIDLKKPEIIVFAGPNGSGKSTVTALANIIEPYINADDIKRRHATVI